MKNLNPDLIRVNAASLESSAKEIDDAQFLLYSRIGTWTTEVLDYLPNDQNESAIMVKRVAKWAPAVLCVLGS